MTNVAQHLLLEQMTMKKQLKTRLEVYRENSKDLIAYYKEKGVLVTITPENPNAENSTEQVINTILEAIKR